MGTLPQWLTFLTSIATLGVAAYAASAWHRTVSAKREDEFSIAAYDLESTAEGYRRYVVSLRAIIEHNGIEKGVVGKLQRSMEDNFVSYRKAYILLSKSYAKHFELATLASMSDEIVTAGYLASDLFDVTDKSAQLNMVARDGIIEHLNKLLTHSQFRSRKMPAIKKDNRRFFPG